MTYISGTLTSANPSADLYALMEPALTSAGYTLVDTVVISTRTHKIWRSNAAGNDANLNWFLDVTYTTTGAGNMWLSPFEDYNAATDTGIRGVVYDATTTVEQTYYSRYGAVGSALETNWTAAVNTFNAIDVSTASFTYWISITQNRVIALSSISVEKVVYCGLWEPNATHAAYVGASSFPLVVGMLGAGTMAAAGGVVGNAGLTRIPFAPSVSRWTRCAVFWTGHYFTNHPEGGYGALGAADVNPFYGNVLPKGKYVYMVFNTGTGTTGFSSDNAIYGSNANAAANVGKLKDVLSFLAASTVTRGDTVTINGETWVLCSRFSSWYGTIAFKAV